MNWDELDEQAVRLLEAIDAEDELDAVACVHALARVIGHELPPDIEVASEQTEHADDAQEAPARGVSGGCGCDSYDAREADSDPHHVPAVRWRFTPLHQAAVDILADLQRSGTSAAADQLRFALAWPAAVNLFTLLIVETLTDANPYNGLEGRPTPTFAKYWCRELREAIGAVTVDMAKNLSRVERPSFDRIAYVLAMVEEQQTFAF